MTFGKLLLRNLFYHWRGNLAVLLGVVVGTAVLTGALLVGDSLRGSLRQLAQRQLGRVDHVLVAGRLFRQELADDLARRDAAGQISPALLLQGTVVGEPAAGAATARAGRVNILGVDPRFWQLWPDGQSPNGDKFWQSAEDAVVLNEALARELGVAKGDKVRLRLQKMSPVPRESILGRPEAAAAVAETDELTVAAVIGDDVPGSRFTLNPGPTVSRNVFVPLARLQQEVISPTGRGKGSPNRPGPVPHPANALLAAGGQTAALQAGLRKSLTLEDWGLVLRGPEERARAFFRSFFPDARVRPGAILRPFQWPRLRDRDFAARLKAGKRGVSEQALVTYYRRQHPYFSLESRQLFIEPTLAAAAHQAARNSGLTDSPTFVYLADQIAGAGKEMNYTVVAALDPSLPPPLGPFLPAGVKQLADDEVVLVEWEQMPLSPSSDVRRVRLKYYDPEERDDRLRSRTLKVRGWIPLRGAADDPDLTPEFPGITDKASLADWDPPRSIHYNPDRVGKPGEDYWKSYRTTPKAYVNLATGQKLWGSRFGTLTSVRLAPRRPGSDAAFRKAGDAFRVRLRRYLQPEQGGFVFDPIRDRALKASEGGKDFGWYFLGFSIFIIAAALILVGLLFRLNLDRRASEVGLLLATGIRRGTVRRLLLAEGALLAVVGGIIGCGAALGYAWLLLEFLRAWWPGGLEASFLHLQGSAPSYLLGYAAALAVSLLTIVWALRVLGRVSPRALLAGETAEAAEAATRSRSARVRLWVGGLSLAGALACVAAGGFVSDPEMQAMTFFTSGFLLLVAGLAAVWAYFRKDRLSPSRHVGTLGVRNAARHPVRSLLTVGLLAAATFLVIAVESFHRDPGRDFYQPGGGSGGFRLYGEAEVPMFLDWHTRAGRAEVDEALRQTVPADRRQALDGVSLYSFRLRGGDDASCLNLAQPRRPRLLGAGPDFLHLRRFHFQDSEAATLADKENPWRLLEPDRSDGAIPVIADATTVAYKLKSKLGGVIEVPDENGRPVQLRIVGLLADSIFQSEVLLSDRNFRRLYPRAEGYRFFLIDAPEGRAGEVKTVLETAFADHGLAVAPTYGRLEAYLAVENTYLATFQALGGLGLLLGALGLAVVLLRGVWERRGELALLRALGFRRSALGWLVFAENSFLLALGLGVGALTALVAVAPHLLGGGGEVPWLRLAALLGLVLVVGLAGGAAAVASTLRAPLLPALRRE
jgi:ABC-type lipoprotein release transport system permease subunit